MGFQIHSLPAEQFADLFTLTDAELEARQACRQIVTSKPGTPCRVSMQDAEVGETVILLNYAHQPHNSPYRASHAIFVRQNATNARIRANEVPDVIRSRIISVRCFDQYHMMIDADVVRGAEVADKLNEVFEQKNVAYVHLHNAKPGCFAALVCRAD